MPNKTKKVSGSTTDEIYSKNNEYNQVNQVISVGFISTNKSPSYLYFYSYLSSFKNNNYRILILIGIFQSNVDIVGISPITNRLMNDFTLCVKIYDSLATAKIYLMENSTYD